MELAQQISQTFSDSFYPGDDKISVPTYDDEGTAEYFKGRKWFGNSLEELRQHSSSLTFFTNEAFCYFVPAYMLAVIEDAEVADVIIDRLWFDLSPPKNDINRPSFQGKWVLFTAAQKSAIVEFMEYVYLKFMAPVQDRSPIDVLRNSLDHSTGK